MALQFIVQRLKSLFLFFIGIFRRALCCFRRKRHPSCDSIPLTAIGVVPNNATNGTADFETWNSWDDASKTKDDTYKPNTVQEHIELYRQQAAMSRQKSTDSEEEVQENFFEDMTPRITRQTKVFLNHDENDPSRNVSSRLSLNPQGIVATEGELGEWEEGAGWEEQTQNDWNTQNILREKRRQERERRLWEQQQKKQEKYMRPLGAKIS